MKKFLKKYKVEIITYTITILICILIFTTLDRSRKYGANPDNHETLSLKFVEKRTVETLLSTGYEVIFEDAKHKTYWSGEITAWDYNNTDFKDVDVPFRESSFTYNTAIYLDNVWINVKEINYTKDKRERSEK